MTTLQQYWQNLPEKMNPVFLQIGNFSIYYYSLMYLLAFITVYLLARYRISRESRFDMNADILQGLMVSLFLGLLIGARIGYVVFYNLSYYLQHPLEIILPFQIDSGWKFVGIAGMSYHGGLIGVIIAGLFYLKRRKLSFLSATDLVIPCIPLGYTFGRLGNFINGELYGRITERPIGMMFPSAPGSSLRHPSQLYEMFGEGLVLFTVLWLLRKRVKTPGAMLAFYLIGYGLVRFIIEYTREPDAHLGLVAMGFSMGQILCLFMILSGIALYIVFKRRTSVKAR